MRQLLTESVILSLGGGLTGMLFAYWLFKLSQSMAPAGAMPMQLDMTPDLSVGFFTLVAAVVAGLGFGLVPALSAARSEAAPALKEGALGPMRGYRRFGIRNLFVVYQVSGSLMLLLITGYIVRGYQQSYASTRVSTRPTFMSSRLTRPVTAIP